TNHHVYGSIQPQTQNELINVIIGTGALIDGARPELPQMLVDAYHPTLAGGTGQRADLDLIRHLPDVARRIMLAGGLTPDNVADTIRDVRPWAVDVASGVEESPGKKDHGKVRAFIQAVREADRDKI
ncbi:MAG TPA: hypothetical protein VMT34_04850, partial [Aggregatilineales bacterium]|nr:hypothetical protein [Aggregatilineales bacterium]